MSEQGTDEHATDGQGSNDSGSEPRSSARRGRAGQDAGPFPTGPGSTELGQWELPWAEPFGTGSAQRARVAGEFGAALRKTGSLMNLVGQAAADRIGINATDLNCLNILSFSGALTAGELARATGLTTASITGVVDRLEHAGFVRRERDAGDRRRVVVHLELEKALSEVATVFVPMMRDWQQLAAGYSDEELLLIVRFYGQMEQVFRDHIIRLRGGDPRDPAAGQE